MQFIIEAVVQPAKHSPWIKVAYISNNNDVDYHMTNILQKEYFDVASVKSSPADSVTLAELRYDRQGNTSNINGTQVYVEPDSTTD